jgi:RNA polymerase sigma-70 factor (ECF subfamily)
LARAAWRNIANLLRGEQRRKAREEKFVENSGENLVELHPSVGNSLQTEASLRQRMAEMLRALQDPVDRKVLELRMMGERRTQRFAEVMGISDLPPSEQRQKVKRAKDRIEKLLQRKKGLRK